MRLTAERARHMAMDTRYITRVSVLVGYARPAPCGGELIGDAESGAATVTTVAIRAKKARGRSTGSLLERPNYAFWTVHVSMRIAPLGRVSTAMARQHMDLFAICFARGGATQIF